MKVSFACHNLGDCTQTDSLSLPFPYVYACEWIGLHLLENFMMQFSFGQAASSFDDCPAVYSLMVEKA